MIKLNLGTGSNKLTGYVNIDVEDSCKPDMVHDFTKGPLPYEENSVDEVVMFHTIEHIGKRLHAIVLADIRRVLKPEGVLTISYPEFTKCVERWKNNDAGMKEFWEATLYGRQLYPSDFHVCIMDTEEFKVKLRKLGFIQIRSTPELSEWHNTVVTCKKGNDIPTYVELVRDDMTSYELRGRE